MKNAENLLTFILASLKEEEGGRVALYHYLKNFVANDTPVSPDLINSFWLEALQLSYWQERKEALFNDIIELLQRYSSASNDPLRLDQVWDITRLQIVSLDSLENLSQVVLEFEQAVKKEGDHLRVIAESKTRVLALHKHQDGRLTLRGYGHTCRIVGNRLLPLGPDHEISYDASLELAQGKIHKLKAAPNSQIRFTVSSEGLRAHFISGFAFRETQDLTVPGINHEPRIFYPLKRLERFFVYRPSDPYYIEVLTTVENAVKMLQNHGESAQAFALQAFDIGQIAFDQVFSDDKILYMRLKELAKYVNLSRRTSDSRFNEEVNL